MMQNHINPAVVVVLRTLAYYDIFRYPLTEQDIILNFALHDNDPQNCKEALKYLTQKGIIHKMGDYYSLNDDRQRVTDRIIGNIRAEQWMKKARRFSRLISGFPYIRGVALSGSLSKGFIGNDPDIDYFIITRPNRLWLARTMLVLFKKIFLLNSYKYFCINYFIDSENLEIEEKNLFTATEVSTLKPVYGAEISRRFFKENQWITAYFPNFRINDFDKVYPDTEPFYKKFAEFLFNGKAGDMLDEWFMRMTIRHWSKKFKDRYSEEEFGLVFKSGKKISKHHPRNFQKKVLRDYRQKIGEIREKFDIELENLAVDN